MPTTHPISISCETHGLAGNLVMPPQASEENPVPGALVLGGPGPVPLQRYTAQGAKQWPVLWTEALAAQGIAGLCWDQRGSGLSTGVYHEADWNDLLEDARAAAEMLKLQPEVNRTAAVTWGEGCTFALELAAEGLVDALVLMAPGYHTAEERYARGVAALAASRGLSDRVVQLRVNQWRRDIEATLALVAQGQETAVTDVGGKKVTTNLRRFLATVAYNPAEAVPKIQVPVLVLHGRKDTIIPPSESEALVAALPDGGKRILYPGVTHFIYREERGYRDAAAWLNQVLG